MEWERNEEYILGLIKIPKSKQKLKILSIYYNFPENKNSITEPYTVFRNAINEIKTCKELKMAFSIILRVGNVLNSGSKMKECADGFGVELLEKMTSLRTNSGKNIFTIINEKLKEKNESYNGFNEKLKNCVEISGNVVADLKSFYSKLQAEVKQLETQITAIETVKDTFYEKAMEYLEVFKKEAEDVGTYIAETDEEFKQLGEMFLVKPTDPKMKNPENFFKLFKQFAVDAQKNMPKAKKRKHGIGKKIGDQDEKQKALMAELAAKLKK